MVDLLTKELSKEFIKLIRKRKLIFGFIMIMLALVLIKTHINPVYKIIIQAFQSTIYIAISYYYDIIFIFIVLITTYLLLKKSNNEFIIKVDSIKAEKYEKENLKLSGVHFYRTYFLILI